MEKPEPLLVVCAILEHQGKVLVARRGPSMDMAGYWEFPGGKVEPNESAEVALKCEGQEWFIFKLRTLLIFNV
jgi:8-oxo-dGTP diphosphatase